ncbi:MAG TPA: stealth conserved region 3 domain-containing protein, partial [Brachybacterium paraconglomeratum]|nr:stealth conserved region 3 domain-containing protein [Brachybacterium paraconglomeratum]
SQESLQPRRRRPAPPAPDVEIDVVLTWVDGTDAAWRARRDAALRALGPSAGPDGVPSAGPSAAPPHPSALDESRFVEADELRHSLRSIHRYANWVRRIHLVTDDQVPPWLDVDHPRIHLVSHRELIGGSRFNSHALEASLHRIPGLAEHYLYLNDDVLLGDIAHPGDFFAAPGISRFFPSDLPIDPGPSTAQDRPIMAAAKNGRDLIRERFGLEVRTRMRHTVHPQLRSIAERIEQEHPEQVARTREAAFRSRTDLSLAASLHHWYAHALGRAVPAEPDYLYVDLAAPGAAQTLDALESLRRYDSFCLNQEEESPDAAMRRELARFLHRYFPHPAPWELPEGPDGPSDSVP